MRRVAIYITIGVFILLSGVLNAQDSSGTKLEKNIYRKSWNLGLMVHTHGFGANFRSEKFKTARLKHFWTIEAYNVRHPKEQRSYGSSGDDSESFVYGKLNHMYTLKGGIGRQKVLFQKDVIRGVQISSVYNINLALAFLKPVYLEVFRTEDDRTFIATERYDPDQHNLSVISGRAPWFNGLDELGVVPGLSAKFALNFEFAPVDNKIKALETGVNIDGYFQPVPIMAFQEDQYVFVMLYLNFQFGRKSYL